MLLEHVSRHVRLPVFQVWFRFQETNRTIEKLRETVSKQDEEIASLRKERIEMEARGKQTSNQSEALERNVLNELNEECRRIAHALGRSVFNPCV